MSEPSELMEEVLDEVRAERDRQDRMWGVQDHHPIAWIAILGEEKGECDRSVLENDYENLEKELVQVAAVAVAAVESIRRRDLGRAEIESWQEALGLGRNRS